MLRIRCRSDGILSVLLGHVEGRVVRDLPARLRAVLEDPAFSDRATSRLFPPAYADPRREKEYRRLLGEDLVRRKLENVEAFERTLRDWRERKDGIEVLIRPHDFELWLGFVNDMRLLLGSELDIADDDWGEELDLDHPGAEDLVLLHFLSWLEDELLRASGFEMPPIDPKRIRKRRKE